MCLCNVKAATYVFYMIYYTSCENKHHSSDGCVHSADSHHSHLQQSLAKSERYRNTAAMQDEVCMGSTLPLQRLWGPKERQGTLYC